MSTFKVNTPNPGWEKRWVREAARLLWSSPGILATLLGVLVAVGLVEEMLRFHVRNFWISNLFVAVKVPLIAAPAVAWFFFQLGRKEGYNHGRFRNYADAARAPLQIMAIVLFLFLLIRVPVETHPVSLWGVLDSVDQSLLLAFLWTVPFTFKLLSIAMMGWMSEDERKVIVEKATVVLVMTLGVMNTFGLLFLLMFLPDFIRLPMMIFGAFWLYVAGREIIGGITGNKQEEKVGSRALSPV